MIKLYILKKKLIRLIRTWIALAQTQPTNKKNIKIMALSIYTILILHTRMFLIYYLNFIL